MRTLAHRAAPWPLAAAARLLSWHLHLPLLIVAMHERGVGADGFGLGAVARTLGPDVGAEALAHRAYGAYHVLSFVGMVGAGWAIDRASRRGVSHARFVAAGGLLMAAGALASAFDPTVAVGLGALGIGRASLEPALVVGALRSGGSRALPALLGLCLAQNVGAFTSAFGTAGLASAGGWPAAFAAVAAALVLSTGIALQSAVGDDSPDAPVSSAAPSARSAWRVLAVCGLGLLVFSAHLSQCQALAAALDGGDAPALSVLGAQVASRYLLQLPTNAALVVLFAAPLAVYASRREVNAGRCLVLGVTLVAGSLAVVAVSSSGLGLLLSTALLSAGEVLVGPALFVWVGRFAPRGRLGLSVGLLYFCRDFLCDVGAGAMSLIELSPWALPGVLVAVAAGLGGRLR